MQLYLNTYGTYLHKQGEMFSIKIDDQKKKISPKRVSSIVISSAATISTDAIQLAMEYNIDVVFLDKYGNPYGRVWFPKLGSTTLIRRKLLEIHMNDTGLDFIKDWISKKMENQISYSKKLLLKRNIIETELNQNIETMLDLKDKMNDIEGKLSEVGNSIMAYEGNVSKYYFKVLSKLIPKNYSFNGRGKRPAKDPFNAFLNYGYGILYSRVERALIIAGLDPYIGLLHTDNYNKKSLVFDFIEPYRILVEQPIYYLFTRHKIHEEHFFKTDKNVTIEDKGKKLLVQAILEHFDEVIRHKKSNMKRIDQIQADAHAFANFLIGKREDY